MVTEHEGRSRTLKEEHVQLRALSNLMVYRMGQACLRLFQTLPFYLPARTVCSGDWTPPHDAAAHDVSEVQGPSAKQKAACALDRKRQ